MSVKTVTYLICDRCGTGGPIAKGTGPLASKAKELAMAVGWVRIHNPEFGKTSKRGMDDLCPNCKS